MLRYLTLPLMAAVLLSSRWMLAEEKGAAPGEMREIETIQEFWKSGECLANAVVQNLDFRRIPVKWEDIDVGGAAFLGCEFRDGDQSKLIRRGALVLPTFSDLPYNPYRSRLYTPAELSKEALSKEVPGPRSPGTASRGYSPDSDGSLDRRIYEHFLRQGKYNPSIVEAVAQRLHDHAIDDALRDYLGVDNTGMPQKKVVGIMGGHGVKRDQPSFAKAAKVAYLLVKEGYYVSTGGGPGVMEAGNLGAYLGNYDPSDIDDAIAILAEATDDTKPAYRVQAEKVLKKYPHGRESLAIPTWFYGHEPSNAFASHVAKYFSNGIREDVLLATAIYGVVYAPGSAGTVQEVFADATQNHYGTFGYYSPMVFMGNEGFTISSESGEVEDQRMEGILRRLSKGKGYLQYLKVLDEPEVIVAFIKTHPPKRP